MPYICVQCDSPDSYPWSDFARAGKGPHRLPDGRPCHCIGVYISHDEWGRRFDETMNRVLGFPRGYTGPRYQGYKP